MEQHKDAPLGERHPLHQWTFANAAARTTAFYISTDIGKEAFQLDNQSFWRVTAVSAGVATFFQLSGPEDMASKEDAANKTDNITDFLTSSVKHWSVKGVVNYLAAVYTTTASLTNLLAGKEASLGYTPVPNTRTVNGQALTANVTLTKTDVGLNLVPNIDTTDAANITSGVLDIARIPAAAIEVLVNSPANEAARYALTTATAQNGDMVKQLDTGEMWILVDQANIGNSAGWTVFTASTASAVPWSGVTTKPTTVSGYGITDMLAQVLTGLASGAGTITATDSLLTAFNKVVGNLALLAPIASPALTGTPTAPTATAGTNTTQIATTTFTRTLFAAPPAIGSTTPAAGSFTTLNSSGTATLGDSVTSDSHTLNGAVAIWTDSTASGLYINQLGTGAALRVDDSTTLDATPFIITGAGDVGIGTPTPYTKLQVDNTLVGAAYAAYLRNTDTTLASEIRLALASNTHTISDNRHAYIGAYNYLGSGNNGNSLTFATNQAGNSPTEKMRILGSVPGVALIATAKLLFDGVDGTGDTFIRETSANQLDFYAGGVNALRLTSTYASFTGDILVEKTITPGGTTGAQTINKNAGSVNFAAAATSLVVTDSRVTSSSVIVATVATNDSTMKSVNAVAATGSFTLTANAAATAETRVNFIILN